MMAFLPSLVMLVATFFFASGLLYGARTLLGLQGLFGVALFSILLTVLMAVWVPVSAYENYHGLTSASWPTASGKVLESSE